jgi:AcrR family transcriptional regulator
MTETPDVRNRRWEATHRRILEIALDLFSDFGFEKVSVGQIATRAGVSVPTFYAHYPSKEHVVMDPPSPAEVEALLATQPADLPVGERIRRAAGHLFAHLPPDAYEELETRWRIIARSPVLRTRAADFERQTAGMVAQLLAGPGGTPGTAHVVQAGAYLAAYTAGLLAWADSNGERKLDETLDEAFRALG